MTIYDKVKDHNAFINAVHGSIKECFMCDKEPKYLLNRVSGWIHRSRMFLCEEHFREVEQGCRRQKHIQYGWSRLEDVPLEFLPK